MSKIIQAINTMISNSSNITKTIQNNRELFFLYSGRYKWSIVKPESTTEEYSLHYYPGEVSLDFLANIDEDDPDGWEDINFITYSTKELKTREARESLAELYLVVKEKIYGVGDALDEIIKTGNSEF